MDRDFGFSCETYAIHSSEYDQTIDWTNSISDTKASLQKILNMIYKGVTPFRLSIVRRHEVSTDLTCQSDEGLLTFDTRSTTHSSTLSKTIFM